MANDIPDDPEQQRRKAAARRRRAEGARRAHTKATIDGVAVSSHALFHTLRYVQRYCHQLELTLCEEWATPGVVGVGRMIKDVLSSIGPPPLPGNYELLPVDGCEYRKGNVEWKHSPRLLKDWATDPPRDCVCPDLEQESCPCDWAVWNRWPEAN